MAYPWKYTHVCFLKETNQMPKERALPYLIFTFRVRDYSERTFLAVNMLQLVRNRLLEFKTFPIHEQVTCAKQVMNK